jgi:hypothetical protein
MRATAVAAILDEVEVECTHCGIKMTSQLGSGRIRYFRCGCCHRWASSTYSSVFRADSKMRRSPNNEESAGLDGFEQAKGRLERWLAALDDQDPYRVLGLSPRSLPEEVRDRYRELALVNHPDRGGCVEKMREINLAYERIFDHRKRRDREALLSEPHHSARLRG